MKPSAENKTELKIAIHIRIPASIATQLTADANEYGKTKDDMASLIFHQHFLMKKAERKLLYRAIPKKVFGAPFKKN